MHVHDDTTEINSTAINIIGQFIRIMVTVEKMDSLICL